MLVRGVLFDDFRALFRSRFYDGDGFDGRLDFGNGNDDGLDYGFDDFLDFLTPEAGSCALPGSGALLPSSSYRSKRPRKRPNYEGWMDSARR
jgi:hypothetical protein